MAKNRLIKTQRLAQGFSIDSGCGFAQHDLDRVAGHPVDKKKDQAGDAEDHPGRHQQAGHQIGRHACPLVTVVILVIVC